MHIYEKVAQQLKSKGHEKSADQCRSKMKLMRTDFYKLGKEDEKVSKQTRIFADKLREIFTSEENGKLCKHIILCG